jgi:hypothetical protein
MLEVVRELKDINVEGELVNLRFMYGYNIDDGEIAINVILLPAN